MATDAAALFNPRFRAFSAAGSPLAGGKVDVYLAGTTTRTNSYPTYNDALNGTNANANPVVLDANGEANIFLPVLSTGGAYKIVLSDASSVVQWTEDNIYPSTSFNTQTVSEWIQDPNSPTRVSASQFKLTGVDRTSIYHAGRRVKMVSSPSAYGTVTASAFVTDTTVTVVVDGGGSVPSGTFSSVQYGIVSYTNPSYLDPRTQVVVTKSGDMTGNFSSALQVTGWSTEVDALLEFASNQFTARYPGLYNISMTLNLTDTAASQGFFLYFAKNGTASTPRFADGTWSTGAIAIGRTYTRLMSLAAGDTIQMWVQCTNNTTIKATHTFICISRVA